MSIAPSPAKSPVPSITQVNPNNLVIHLELVCDCRRRANLALQPATDHNRW